MLKKKWCLYIALCFLPPLIFAESSKENLASNHPISRIFDGSSLKQELAELALMSGVLITDLQLKKQSAWFDTPWMPSKLDRAGSNKITRDLVPIDWIYYFGALQNSALMFLPNNDGFYNNVGYRHAKGFAETVYFITPLMTDVAKLAFGKKRPNYHALVADGTEPKEARKSFWSLHAASAFSMSAYWNLFMFQHTGGGWNRGLGYKIPIAVSLYGASTLVWLSRDYNLDHDDVDLVVGASFGTLMALVVYGIQENFIGSLYSDKQSLSFNVIPNGMVFTKSF